MTSKAWKIEARFADGFGTNEYLSPDVRLADPGWGSEIFNRKIRSLAFYLPIGRKIFLAGMEMYNFFVEASQSLSGRAQRIEAFWILGKHPNSPVVEEWRIGQGKITMERGIFGREWGGAPTSGWKSGLVIDPPVSSIVEV